MIVVDISGAQSPHSGHRGIGRYTVELAHALRTGHADVVDAFAYDDDLPLPPLVVDALGGHTLLSHRALEGRSIDVFHVSAAFEPRPIHSVIPRATIGNVVVTHFDLIPWLMRDRYAAIVDWDRYVTRLGLLSWVDAVLTISKASARDLERERSIDPRRIHVIGAGVGSQFVPPVSMHHAARLLGSGTGVHRAPVVVAAGMDWRKNPETAIAAYARLPRPVRARHPMLVLCEASPDYVAWVRSVAQTHGVSDDVIVPGFVSDEILVAAYQVAAVVVFPSRYEGFGLPVLEARHCGARVLCSDAGSLPEVMPLREARFAPDDVEGLASRLDRALTDPAFAAVLDAAPIPDFTWERTARATVDVYADLLRRARVSASSR